MPATDAHIAAIRTDYRLAALDESMAGDNPISFFRKWFEEAEAAAITEVNAMTLATADANGQPHARIVLLKNLDDTGFIFYTNYESEKGRQLAVQPNAALVFFWKELERQVRIEGPIERVSAEESDAYFNSRPAGSRIGAWASPQSKKIEAREELEVRAARFAEKYRNTEIPRPEHWGGYRIVPEKIEFWQGRSNRLHDRIVFEKDGQGWQKYRLAP